MNSSLTLYSHTPKIYVFPLLLARCSYSKKIEAGSLKVMYMLSFSGFESLPYSYFLILSSLKFFAWA
jgi:hypothetical protein